MSYLVATLKKKDPLGFELRPVSFWSLQLCQLSPHCSCFKDLELNPEFEQILRLFKPFSKVTAHKRRTHLNLPVILSKMSRIKAIPNILSGFARKHSDNSTSFI